MEGQPELERGISLAAVEVEPVWLLPVAPVDLALEPVVLPVPLGVAVCVDWVE